MNKLISLIAVAVVMLVPVQLTAGNLQESGDDFLYLESQTVKSGDSFDIPVLFENRNIYSAFQCDIIIPEGIDVEMDEDGEYCISMEESRFTSKHLISSSMMDDGSLRVVCYANPTNDIKGNDGALFYIKARANEDFVGEAVIRISNITFSTAQGVETNLDNSEAVINVVKPVYDFLYLESRTVKSGDSFDIPVLFENRNIYSAFQCDIIIPEGIDVEMDEDGEYCISMEESRFTSKHLISSSMMDDGSLRVVCYANPTNDIKGNDGALFYIKARANEDFVGEAVIRISNITFSTAQGVETNLDNSEAVINVVASGSTTGVGIMYSVREKCELYNIKGQRIDDTKSLSRGVYIVNGKKIFKND